MEAICPPKLEDAGLEDCALPPEAIKEAFLKAANFVKSRIIAGEEEGDDDNGCCVEDPGPSSGEVPDALVGAGELPTKPFCGGVREKGSLAAGEEQGLAGDVVVVGAGEDPEGGSCSDKVVVLGGEEGESGPDDWGKKACVGEEVGKGDKEKKNRGEDDDSGDGEEPKLTLAEVLI